MGSEGRISPTAGQGNLLYRTLARRPNVAKAVDKLARAFAVDGCLRPEIRELIRSRIASQIGCQYCATLNEQASTPSSAREEMALELAESMLDVPVSVSDELFARLRAVFTEDELVELAAWISYVVIGGQTFGAAMGLPRAENVEVIAFARVLARQRSRWSEKGGSDQ